jgi:hypothetical protein
MGGMYERLIKEVKRALARTLQRRKVNKIELNIAVHEAAHRINCRPLTENSLDAEDGEVLTPHHLAKGRSGWPLLPGIHKNMYSIAPEKSIYRRGRMLTDEIMRKFTSRYLPTLAKRGKWHKDEMPARVGDLVMVIEPNKTRREWERARIKRIHLGRDGIVRSADVRMFDGRVKKIRAVRNLVKLNLSKDLSEKYEIGESSKSTHVTVNGIFEFDKNQSCASKLNDTIVNKAKNSEKLTMGRGKQLNYILIEGLDASMKLSEVVKELAPQWTSIVAIYRVHDYVKRINSENLILSLMCDDEFAVAVAARHEINAADDYKILFPDLLDGTGYFPTNFAAIDEERVELDPKPLYVFDMPKQTAGTSKYLAKVLETLEGLADVTGFKWNLAKNNKSTRNFGFALLNDKNAVLRLAGQRITVDRDSIRLNSCNSTTVLIHASRRELLNHENKAILSPGLSRANWLHADVVISDDSARTELETIKVTIRNDQPIQATQSAPLMDVRDDTVVISADNHELSDMEIDPRDTQQATNVESNDLPCSSAQADENDLRSRLTAKALAQKPVPISTSRFIRMRMHGSYPFMTFNRLVARFITDYTNVAYFERYESATAYIQFEEVKTAVKFKKLMESFNKNKQISIDYAEEKGSKVIKKVQSKEQRPKEDTETIYYVNKDGDIIRCRFGEDYLSFVFPPPDHVANSSRQI